MKNTFQNKSIVIFGATSTIAEAYAKQSAHENTFYLIGRNTEKLQIISKHLEVTGASKVYTTAADLSEFDKHPSLVQNIFTTLGKVDIVLFAHGTMSDEENSELNYEKTLSSLKNNALSIISLLTLIRPKMEEQQSGSIAVITSVAGDCNLRRNFIYASEKAFLSAYIKGLSQKLYSKGIQVLDIKPGRVKSPMTAGMKQDWSIANPEVVAKDIIKAIQKRKFVVYTPFYWRYIVYIIRSIPMKYLSRLDL